jgi:RNA polymerase sigma-70 factor (ECF subfamily)
MDATASPIRIDELHGTYADAVARLSRRMIRNRAAADDAAQEAWLEIVKSLPSFGGRSSISTWLYTVARRTIMRVAQKEKRYSTRFLAELFDLNAEDGLAEYAAQPDEFRLEWLRSQCEACLTAVLHCVHNDDRFIYLLRRVGNLSFAEIAEVMEKSEVAVRQSHSRSGRKISRFLGGHCLLYNPQGNCRCKLKAPLQKEADAWAPIRSVSRKLYFLREADHFHFPQEKIRKMRDSCHETEVALH